MIVLILDFIVLISQRRIILGGSVSPILLNVQMIDVNTIRSLAEDKLTDEMFIVDLQVSSGNLISVLIDSDSGVSIEKCIEISRHIEHSFDREEEDFALEVSSPGLTEPFKVLRQYQKYTGRDIEVITAEGEKLKGLLKSADEKGIDLEVTKKMKIEGKKKKTLVTQTFSFNFDQIKSAKCVISFK
jgi:ribosome maturation factor RimP